MEPERRIEKLLRAFAKKRREQAPESMELHSAVRQQLHREIARRAEGRAGGSFFAKLFSKSRPRFAFAVGLVAIVSVVGFFLIPLMNKPRFESLSMSKLSVGKAPPKEVPSSASAPPPTVAAPSPASAAAAPPVPPEASTLALDDKRKALADDVPKHAGVSVEAAGEIQKPAEVSKDTAVQTNLAAEMTALSAPPSGTPMLAFKTEAGVHSINDAALNSQAPAPLTPTEAPAPGINASAAPATFAANENETKSPVRQTAPASVAADSATFNRLARREAAPPQPVTTQHFYRLNLPAASPRAAGASPAPVLATFQVERNGDQLRVIDGDGSVYTGAVQIVRGGALPGGLVAAEAQNKPATAEDMRHASSAIENYFFRVTGTNRNLKQNLVFTGNFIPLTNTASRRTGFGGLSGTISAGRAAAEPAAASPTAAEPAESPVSLLNARISGKVIIGNQKEIEVNAAPSK